MERDRKKVGRKKLERGEADRERGIKNNDTSGERKGYKTDYKENNLHTNDMFFF